jgi:tripartite-type tricarboxylate transporter receptor subunit TctC
MAEAAENEEGLGMPSISKRVAALSALLALTLVVEAHAQGESGGDFFKGKTITIGIGAGPGGGYDTNTRIFARHFAKYIPGHPTIVPQNVPGAGGLSLASSLYNVSPRDGTSLGVFAASIALEPVFGNAQAKYDTNGFEWIGSLERDTPSCGVWKGAGQDIRTLDDLINAKQPVLFGATSPSATSSQHALLLKNYLGAPVKVIYGYQGTNDYKLAMERGELTASCGMLETTVKGVFLNEFQTGVLKIFVQFGPDRAAPFFGDATRIYDKAKSPEDRQVLDVIFRQAELARPLAAPPGMPKERVALLRKAMLETLRDPELVAEAAKIGVGFNGVSGEEVQQIFAGYSTVPKPMIAKALDFINKQ